MPEGLVLPLLQATGAFFNAAESYGISPEQIGQAVDRVLRIAETNPHPLLLPARPYIATYRAIQQQVAPAINYINDRMAPSGPLRIGYNETIPVIRPSATSAPPRITPPSYRPALSSTDRRSLNSTWRTPFSRRVAYRTLRPRRRTYRRTSRSYRRRERASRRYFRRPRVYRRNVFCRRCYFN